MFRNQQRFDIEEHVSDVLVLSDIVLIATRNGRVYRFDGTQLTVLFEVGQPVHQLVGFSESLLFALTDGQVLVIDKSHIVDRIRDKEVCSRIAVVRRGDATHLIAGYQSKLKQFVWKNNKFEHSEEVTCSERFYNAVDAGSYFLVATQYGFYRWDDKFTLLKKIKSVFYSSSLPSVVQSRDGIFASDGTHMFKVSNGTLAGMPDFKKGYKLLCMDPFLVLSYSEASVFVLGGYNYASVPGKLRRCAKLGKMFIMVYNNHFDTFYLDVSYLDTVKDMNKAICLARALGIKDKLAALSTQYALELFNQGSFRKAFDLFIEFHVDPKLVIALFSQDISGTPNHDEAHESLSIKSIPTIGTVYQNNVPRSIRYLMPYLTDMRRLLMKTDDSEAKKLVDTALFRCYLLVNRGLIGPLVRVSSSCDPDVVTDCLTEQHMWKELVDFYFAQKLHDKALDLLTKLADENESAKVLVVDYLKKIDNLYIVLNYAEWLARNYPEYIPSIFMTDTAICESMDYERVYDWLDCHVSHDLSLSYLEFVVDEFNCSLPKIHTILVERYIESVETKKLTSLLQTTNYYEPRTVLRLLTDANLPLLKVWPFKRLGMHKEIIDLYVSQGQFQMAHDYCSSLEDKKLTTKLLMDLLDYYLENDNLPQIYQLLSDCNLPLMDVLDKLPATITVDDLLIYITNSVRRQQQELKDSQVLQSLEKLQLLQVHNQVIEEDVHYKIIYNDSLCSVCGKKLNKNLTWFKNDIVHVGCVSMKK